VAVAQYTFKHKQYTEQHNNFSWKAFCDSNPEWYSNPELAAENIY